ncbi:helix-turn-helix domain-containing protein [Streptomyces radicis]|nr:helix-turn-helix transcriptional regulator [Streptomyces radicis]
MVRTHELTLTQLKLAKAVGYTRAYVSTVESGVLTPSEEFGRKIHSEG